MLENEVANALHILVVHNHSWFRVHMSNALPIVFRLTCFCIVVNHALSSKIPASICVVALSLKYIETTL